jgi:hypothetical protein
MPTDPITLRCRVCGREEPDGMRFAMTPRHAVVEERTCGLHFDPCDPSAYSTGDCSVRWFDADGHDITPRETNDAD